jgi:cell division protein FtsN
MAKRTTKRATKRRRKPTAGASRHDEQQSAVWLGLMVGLAIGLLVAFLIYLKQADKPSSPDPTAAENIPKKIPVPPKPEDLIVPTIDAKYDFYKLLPNQTVDVPTGEYQDKKKNTTVLIPAIKPITSNSKKGFTLQAGSFRKSEDADRRKAQLAMMGLEAHVEKVRLRAGNTHRVIIGPYATAPQAQRIKMQLHHQSIQTVLVKAKK